MPGLSAGIVGLVGVVLFGIWMWRDGCRRGDGLGDPQVRWFASQSLAAGDALRAVPVLVLEVRNPGPVPLQLSLARPYASIFSLRSHARSLLTQDRSQGSSTLAWHPLDPPAWSVAPHGTGVFLLTPQISVVPGIQHVRVDCGTILSRRYRLPACELLFSW